jgi:hypothetical protein
MSHCKEKAPVFLDEITTKKRNAGENLTKLLDLD